MIKQKCHGPTAMTGKGHGCLHVYRIYIRAFFSIYLNANEMFVEKIGETLIFK